ncbi:hypothetical protein EDB83DRAFT_2412300 [Lactarius deliciosus]|nr:hypothetical protein EDB83DRAFT_2412300 [Lactarius deliciosus]
MPPLFTIKGFRQSRASSILCSAPLRGCHRYRDITVKAAIWSHVCFLFLYLLTYYDGESISGQVTIRVREGKRTTHDGIKVEFMGNTGLFYDRGHRYLHATRRQQFDQDGGRH